MKRLLQLLVLLAAFASMAARAGSACVQRAPDTNSVMQALELAQKSKLALDASGAQVALIARVGQDLSKYHLRYSHMAFIWRQHPGERWNVVHELNRCGTAESSLYDEGLGNFFLDNMFVYETMLVIPDSETQAHLAVLLSSDAYLRLHASQYNMVSYPFSTKYQNSNQWVLETLAAASARDVAVTNRVQAQSWLSAVGYQPTTLDIPMATRLGADLFSANVAFDDHPFDRRMAGKIDTVTVESVVRFIEGRNQIVQKMNIVN
jgi:hypothetical protein